MSSSTAETLRKAKAVLQERGWTQGVFQDDDGKVCALGACRVVILGAAYPRHGLSYWPEDTVEAYLKAERALERCLPEDVGSVARFNDDFAKDVTDVEQVFDCAIRKAEEATA